MSTTTTTATDGTTDQPLTKEQIENWRKVLCHVVGPYAFFMSENDIELFRKRFENVLSRKGQPLDVEALRQRQRVNSLAGERPQPKKPVEQPKPKLQPKEALRQEWLTARRFNNRGAMKRIEQLLGMTAQQLEQVSRDDLAQ